VLNPYRLPRRVLPQRYALTLTPDLPSSSFAGAADIDHIGAAIRKIQAHGAELARA
jgi:hypothetical protein